jgi:hypothetical protein
MQHKTFTAKFLLTLVALGLLIWLGGSIIRTAIAYDLYEPGTALKLKSWYSDSERLHAVRMYGMGALYTDIAYCVALAASILLCIYWRKNMKQRGWLFMAFVLMFIAAPIELFMIYLDIKLNIGLYWVSNLSFDSVIIKNYFMFRFTKMAIPSMMSYLAIVTSILFVIWRPLDLKQPSEAESLKPDFNVKKN